MSSVAALGSKARERRVIGSGPKAGEEFDVMVPSHVSALVQFESGQSAQAMFSFDSALPRTLLEINGTDATMLFPDPNYFDGEISVQTAWRRGLGDGGHHEGGLVPRDGRAGYGARAARRPDRIVHKERWATTSLTP